LSPPSDRSNTALIAWELGNNLGHLYAMKSVAQRLTQDGWRCVFALCDLEKAYSVLGNEYEFLQAPASRQLKRFNSPSLSFADELPRMGYGSIDELTGLVKGWRTLMRYIRPDLVILDLSPTASLAARTLQIPSLAIGNGYCIPPEISPWPAYPGRKDIALIPALEAKVLKTINGMHAIFGAPAFESLSQLFPSRASLVASVPELDHYQRTSGRFIGPLNNVSSGEIARWPVTRGKADKGPELAKVYLYLQSNYPPLTVLFEALADLPVQVVGYIPGLSDQQRLRLQTNNIELSAKPLHIAKVLEEANFAITHASTITQTILLHGLPVLVLPTHVEQSMLGTIIEKLGIGISCVPTKKIDLVRALKRLTTDVAFKEKTEQFASRNSRVCSNRALDEIALLVNQLAHHN
jgi:UDP:flavonoid glycosyltransferase YjiC (YdhE family)